MEELTLSLACGLASMVASAHVIKGTLSTVEDSSRLALPSKEFCSYQILAGRRPLLG